MRKAKVKDTDCIINVMPKDTGGYIGSDGVTYKESQLDFLSEESSETATIAEGWIARDEDGSLTLFKGDRPHRGKDYIAYAHGGPEGFWVPASKDKYRYEELPQDLFPSVTWETEPRRCIIEIKLTD